MNIIIIGSGHVASVLGLRMLHSGHAIRYVWSRNPDKGRLLAKTLGAGLMPNNWDSWPPGADIVFVAVNDDAYPLLAARFPRTGMLILHSAGAVSKDIFAAVSSRTGVLYPIQSIRAETEQSGELPLLIDAASATDLLLLKNFALSLSSVVTQAGDETRMKYHLAAVFAANFANHLFSLAEDYCIRQGLDFQFLLPLLEETVSRMRSSSPAALQTGPALRGDRSTIEKHLLLLKDDPEMTSIYNMLTKSIMDFYS